MQIRVWDDGKGTVMDKRRITRKAYAKINLGLDVVRRRPDGYHEVKMIMQTVGIHDVLTFEKQEEKGIFLVVEDKNIPGDKSNLIYRAAELILEAYPVEEGVRISLEKKIPVAAGMAGGSTDAAAVFHGLNELFDLKMTEETMREMGVKIGADVPYCIMGGTALSEGIGEVLTPLPAPPFAYIAVAKPELFISTKYVYENLHADSLAAHPDIDGMVQAIREGCLSGITDRMENVLETVTQKEYPVIAEIKAVMKEEGAQGALMSGSGPTVFGIFKEEEKARKAIDRIVEKQLSAQVYVTEFVNETKEA